VTALGTGPRDPRAWDATISGPGWSIGVEAETRVRDLQAVERRLTLKQRDGDVSTVILLLGDTRHHRTLVRNADAALAIAFPTPARTALRLLRRGEGLSANAVVVL
jgi:hypothetical protein